MHGFSTLSTLVLTLTIGFTTALPQRSPPKPSGNPAFLNRTLTYNMTVPVNMTWPSGVALPTNGSLPSVVEESVVSVISEVMATATATATASVADRDDEDEGDATVARG